jgi:hypothetical protein
MTAPVGAAGGHPSPAGIVTTCRATCERTRTAGSTITLAAAQTPREAATTAGGRLMDLCQAGVIPFGRVGAQVGEHLLDDGRDVDAGGDLVQAGDIGEPAGS